MIPLIHSRAVQLDDELWKLVRLDVAKTINAEQSKRLSEILAAKEREEI